MKDSIVGSLWHLFAALVQSTQGGHLIEIVATSAGSVSPEGS